MNAIAAIDENRAIGRDGHLLCHIPGDLKYFKQRTTGKHIIIGRKTLDSFPGGKPLPERNNIVLTKNPDFEREGCRVCHSVSELDDLIEGIPDEEIFVAGGQSVYEQLMDRIDAFYITRILHAFEDADAWFSDIITRADIKLAWRSELQEENGMRYYFARYERVK